MLVGSRVGHELRPVLLEDVTHPDFVADAPHHGHRLCVRPVATNLALDLEKREVGAPGTPISSRYWTGQFFNRIQRLADARVLTIINVELCLSDNGSDPVDDSVALLVAQGGAAGKTESILEE